MNARGRVFSYETGVLFLLCLTFGFVFFDRNAAGYLSPFIAAELKSSTTRRSACWDRRSQSPGRCPPIFWSMVGSSRDT